MQPLFDLLFSPSPQHRTGDEREREREMGDGWIRWKVAWAFLWNKSFSSD
jgi:hypothetical protein